MIPRSFVLALFASLALALAGRAAAQERPEVGRLLDDATRRVASRDLDAAEALLERALAIDSTSAGTLYDLGCVASLRGDRVRAFGWLEKAIGAGFASAQSAKTDRDLAALRDDPRFAALLAKMDDRATLDGKLAFRSAELEIGRPLEATVTLDGGATLAAALGLTAGRFTIELQAFLDAEERPFHREEQRISPAEAATPSFHVDLAAMGAALATIAETRAPRTLELIVSGKVGAGPLAGVKYGPPPGCWRQLSQGKIAIVKSRAPRIPKEPPDAPPSGGASGGIAVARPKPIVVPPTGIFRRDDGAVFRLARHEQSMIGYRVDGAEMGWRVALRIEEGGQRFSGTATGTKRADETGYVEARWELRAEPDGSLRGTFETPGATRLAWSEEIPPVEVSDLDIAAIWHIRCDGELKAGAVESAAGALALAKQTLRDGSPEVAAIQARIDALEERSKAAGEAREKGNELERVADHLFEQGDMAGARARWLDIRKADRENERVESMIGLCGYCLRADELFAAKDRAGLAEYVKATWTQSENAWDFLAHAYISGRLAALSPDDLRPAFDRAAWLWHAGRWEAARDALAAIVKRTPDAHSPRGGFLALDALKGLEDAIPRRTAYQRLEDRRNELRSLYQMDTEEYAQVDRLYQEHKNAIEHGTKLLADYFDE